MQTHTDVFEKVRSHDRSAVLAAAREADVLPYFHVQTSPAMPVVQMEGAERIMLGCRQLYRFARGTCSTAIRPGFPS